MSHTTSVLLYIGPDDEPGHIELLNQRVSETLTRDADGYETRYRDSFELREVSAGAGGWKGPEPLYYGGFNYLPLEDYLKVVMTVPWQQPDRVQVFVHVEGDDGFTVITLAEMKEWAKEDGWTWQARP